MKDSGWRILDSGLAISDQGSNQLWCEASCSKIADACVAVGFAEFLVCRLHDQPVVQEGRGRFASEQPREADLASGRREQIFAADHQVDALAEVVHADRELVGPIAESIADQTRLCRRSTGMACFGRRQCKRRSSVMSRCTST